MAEMRLRWLEGERLSGWTTDLDDLKTCRGLERISGYMSGWGQLVDESIARALGTETVEGGRRIVRFTAEDVARVEAIIARQQATRAAKRAGIATVRCDCGHTVEAKVAMRASLGSSCPECYDRMSDGE